MPGAMFAVGDAVTLRTIEEEDVEFLAAGRNDPDIRRPLTVNRPSNAEQNREFFENAISDDEDVNLLICVAERSEATEDASGEERPARSAAERSEATEDASGEERPARSAAERSESEDESTGTESVSADGGAEAFEDDADANPVGMISLFDEDDIAGTATLAYWVLPEAQGNGYGTEATGLLCEYAFAERRLNKLRADVLATNEGSRRVLEKLGFAEEGLLREEKFVYGDYVDVHRYGLLADDWEGV